MLRIPQEYLAILKRRDFFILTLTLLLGQMASGLLLISLVSSIFSKTSSNFGVSGIVLSFSLPSFLLMVLAGFAADLIDRKKLIIYANSAITLVVLLILLIRDSVFATIPLSFLYFAGNTFFFPAVTAASAQIVAKTQLKVANSIFVLTLTGGQITGFLIGALTLFFIGNFTTLVICEILLVMAVVLSLSLPKLMPKIQDGTTLVERILNLLEAFVYIFKAKIIWFPFLTFAVTQGVIAFGVTLTPGFFNEVAHLPIDKSPLFILPLVAVGIFLGVAFVQSFQFQESFLVALGLGVSGLTGSILGLFLKLGILQNAPLLVLVGIFEVAAVFGVIVAMVTSRTMLQKRVSHHYQGTVFGANTMLASFVASVISPLAATTEVLIGYVNILIFAGLIFLVVSGIISQIGRRWKF